MSTEVTLPALGESVTEGTISRWLKAVGDTVEVDEPLLEVSTDKVDTEIPSPVAGVLLEIRFDEDDVAQVGEVLAVVGDADEASDDSPSDEPSEEPAADEAEAPSESDEETPDVADEEDVPDDQPEVDAGPAVSSADTTEVTLPALGESVTEGTVSRWLKDVGDMVEADEPLLEVSTDKVDTEIPSPTAGTLLEIMVKEDEVAEVGAVLAVIGDASAQDVAEGQPVKDEAAEEPQQEKKEAKEKAPAPSSKVDRAKAEEAEPEQSEQDKGEPEAQPAEQEKQEKPEHSEKVQAAVARRAMENDSDATYVTPLVRKLAKEHGVELASVKGSGVGGRIRKQDVLAAAEEAKKAEAAKAEAPQEKPAAKAEPAQDTKSAPVDNAQQVRGTTEKLSRMRRTIAARMVESLQVAAQLTATVEVDLTAISRIRAAAKADFKKREGASLSYLPFIAAATVEALKAHPLLGATIDTDAGTVTYPDGEHIGIAVDTERGLMVPVIKDAGDLNITGIARKIGDLAKRTREGKVGPDELSGGSFTITNYGSAGTLFDTPIINIPQVAILGTGALVKRPVVVTDEFGADSIAVRDMMYLSLSYDHRLIDGAVAARFLSTIKARLEEGDFGAEFGL